jgi:hypothetical protein
MTTTLRAKFDGKVLVPIGKVDLPIDQEVELQVSALVQPPRGSPAAVLEAMKRLPHLAAEDIDELERSIATGKTIANGRGAFDDEP